MPTRGRSKVLLTLIFALVIGSFVFVEQRHSEAILNKLEEKFTGVQNLIKEEIRKTQNDLIKNKNEISNVLKELDYLTKPESITYSNEPSIKLVNSKDIATFRGDILFLVTSGISHKDHRHSIRTNWGDSARFTAHRQKYGDISYKVYFMTGFDSKEISNARVESVKFKDMLITNRTEHYFDLGRRVMLGLSWSVEHCRFKYLMKADDDVFIHIPNLFKLVYTDPFMLQHADMLYAGLIYPDIKVNRDKESKWYVSKEEWAEDTYPLYASGMGFILSRLVVEKMRPHFDWVKPFRLDDVYIGMLVNKANVPRIGIRVIKSRRDENQFLPHNNPRRCIYYAFVIVYHKVIFNQCMEKLTESSL
ncbi:beta-1,3-galactosyltransferase 5-like [Clytia hemisphaerica]|uniref:beta-1,3-galactosyltransferase 5-like n=1 Tax=Clytia hemisphaerica TaxID=252671 RepID=UPI0034D500FE